MITTKDGTQIFHKDWGPKDAQPIVFHHGWPLSSDDWDAQMLFFLANGYRVVAHDRRGHGRSSQVGTGHDMDHYASDASAVVEHLDLKNAIHIGHSTGGGEVARYVAKYGQPQGRVAKAVLIASVPPLMLKTESNPGGTPIEVFDGFRNVLATNRAQSFLDFASGPFYGFNRPGAKALQGVIRNWWRQGMMGGALDHYEGIKAFSEVDQTDDLNQGQFAVPFQFNLLISIQPRRRHSPCNRPLKVVDGQRSRARIPMRISFRVRRLSIKGGHHDVPTFDRFSRPSSSGTHL